MIPSKFDYILASSVDEAVKLLGEHGAEAKVLSGGHSLLPMMKFRLAAPKVLIDIGRIRELQSISEEGDEIVIGGLVTHRMLETSELLWKKSPLLAETAACVGDVQVRNRGTIGGSLAHADPASDLPAAVLALEARMKIVGPGGTREVAADRFFVGMLQSSVESNEILTEIRFRKPAGKNGASYKKVAQSASGFAIVGVAAALTLKRKKCTDIKIGITGVSAVPYRARAAEALLADSDLGREKLQAAGLAAVEGVDPLSDIHASGDYRRQLAIVYTRRSIESALAAALAS